MEYIDWSHIPQYSISGKLVVPTSVDYHCPLCGRNVNFSLGWTGVPYDTYVTRSRCAGCKGSPVFVYIWAQYEEQSGQIKGDLFIHPKSKKRKEIVGLNEIPSISEELKEEYNSALNIYNIREWKSATGACRRLLEGLMQTLTPESEHRKTLNELILVIDKYVDLKQPIKDVADIIRIAGNKGAHFDPLSKPNDRSTEIMFDLMDYLIEYFFILPNKIKSLHEEVESLARK